MHIGLIGGIGPAATDFYYRRLISTFASKKAELELTIVHADTPTLLGNLASNNAATQVAIYMKLTNRFGAAPLPWTGCRLSSELPSSRCSSILPVGESATAGGRSSSFFNRREKSTA